MATTAYHMSSLDIPAVDDMDMHSDSAFDFGDVDGDIEFDLEPAPPTQGEDDDVSIVDVVSELGQDTQPGLEEQDDYMVDPEDVIEEDDLYPAGDDVIAVDKDSVNSVAMSQTPTLAQADEDLIDYSDDEDDESSKHPDETQEHVMVEIIEAQTDVSQHQEEQEGCGTSNVGQIEDFDHVDQHGDVPEINPDVNETDEQQTTDQTVAETKGHGDAIIGDDEASLLFEEHHDDGSTLEDEQNERQEKTNDDLGENDTTNEDLDVNEPANEDGHYQDTVPTDLRTITVNYAGNELWLFKQHDHDDSGDWLLDDLSLTKSTISHVFQACRTSLGDDVSSEHELGFRFDHFHSLELYEDNTACVAVSLEKLVDLYHTLQAQDGNQQPESFYISLLFRPRFITLLSDVAKFAENGSGYSALSAAVTAGETRFTNVFSESPSEQSTEWDDEQDNIVTDEQEVSAHNEVQQEEVGSESGSQEHDVTDEDRDQQQTHECDDGINYEKTATANLLPGVHEHVGTVAPVVTSGVNESADTCRKSPEQQESTYPIYDDVDLAIADTVSEADARRAQEENDLVDYSDDEDEQNIEKEEAPSADASSPSSSTVQGDEPIDRVDHAYPVAAAAAASDTDADARNTITQVETVKNDSEQTVTEGDDDIATLSPQDRVVKSYDTDQEVETSEDRGEDINQPDPHDSENTNQDLATYDHEKMKTQPQPDLANGSVLYTDDEGFEEDDYTKSDALLEFENASAGVTNQGPIVDLSEDATPLHDDSGNFEGDEAGVAKDSAAAVTSNATAVAVSSNGPKLLSPQGRKRSIDEAGYGSDDALDFLDTKRPKVQSPRLSEPSAC